MRLRTRRRWHWIVPAAILASTAGVAALPDVLRADAGPVPVLPALTPAQLLEKVRNAQVSTLSGDVTLTSHLGLPDLASLGVRSGTFLDLLSGTHVAHVWIDGPEHVRLAIDSPQAESDWIRNGIDLWSWDSSNQHVLHATLPAEGAVSTNPRIGTATTELDPMAVAGDLLAAVDPTTAVTVRTPGYVAGRPVYELVVSPRSASSTIADGVISVDAATGVPLAVRVDARATGTPAVQVTFTSVSFDQPAASVFAFAPPPGAIVEQADDPSQLLPLGRVGRGAAHKVRNAAGAAAGGTATPNANPRPARTGVGPSSKVTTIGTGWDAVAVIAGLDLGRQFQTLFSGSPAVTVGAHSAHLVSTALLNVLVLDDGRIAVGAVTAEALEAAVATA